MAATQQQFRFYAHYEQCEEEQHFGTEEKPNVAPLCFIEEVVNSVSHPCRKECGKNGAPGGDSLNHFYGRGTVSPGNRLAQFVIGTPANRAVPVMSEFESQKTSVALPPNRV